MGRRTSLAALVIAVTVLGISRGAADTPDGWRWWSHVAFLADDALERRETGSPGHRKAAEYVAGEFEKLGLRAASTDGYLQPVELKSLTIDEAHCRLALVRDKRGEGN
jgi:hypothetical protein